MPTAKIIALCNQKGGVTKTTTTANLGVGLAMQGKRVLLVDADPQADLTTALGFPNQDTLETTLATIMGKLIRDESIHHKAGILCHDEGVHLLPSSIELSNMDMALINAMSRELVLRNYLNTVKREYDYILIDCMPSLGMITINALAAADSVIIPVQAQYLPAKGMTALVQTIQKVQRQINPSLKIDGVLMTLVDNRTNLAKQVTATLRENYGGKLKIYNTQIPMAVKAAETSVVGQSIFTYDKGGKVAVAYGKLTKEVLGDTKVKSKTTPCR